MFNDSQSFYFSVEGDITHTHQRKMGPGFSPDTNSDVPFWHKVWGKLSPAATKLQFLLLMHTVSHVYLLLQAVRMMSIA